MSAAKSPNDTVESHAITLDEGPFEGAFDASVSVQALIETLGLLPHPEGGYYRETYRDAVRVLRESALSQIDGAETKSDEVGLRNASTAIYYLLNGDAFSAWHRIRSDEIWHFYAGDPLDVHVLRADGGGYLTHRLGNPLQHNVSKPHPADPTSEVPVPAFQAVVKAGDWFAAGLAPSVRVAPFALVGCTVAPGFTFSDFEIADAARLSDLHAAYPTRTTLIERFSRR